MTRSMPIRRRARNSSVAGGEPNRVSDRDVLARWLGKSDFSVRLGDAANHVSIGHARAYGTEIADRSVAADHEAHRHLASEGRILAQSLHVALTELGVLGSN